MLVMVVFFIAFRWIHLSTPLIRLFLLVLILLLMPTLNFLPVWFALSQIGRASCRERVSLRVEAATKQKMIKRPASREVRLADCRHTAPLVVSYVSAGGAV